MNYFRVTRRSATWGNIQSDHKTLNEALERLNYLIRVDIRLKTTDSIYTCYKQ